MFGSITHVQVIVTVVGPGQTTFTTSSILFSLHLIFIHGLEFLQIQWLSIYFVLEAFYVLLFSCVYMVES